MPPYSLNIKVHNIAQLFNSYFCWNFLISIWNCGSSRFFWVKFSQKLVLKPKMDWTIHPHADQIIKTGLLFFRKIIFADCWLIASVMQAKTTKLRFPLENFSMPNLYQQKHFLSCLAFEIIYNFDYASFERSIWIDLHQAQKYYFNQICQVRDSPLHIFSGCRQSVHINQTY